MRRRRRTPAPRAISSLAPTAPARPPASTPCEPPATSSASRPSTPPRWRPATRSTTRRTPAPQAAITAPPAPPAPPAIPNFSPEAIAASMAVGHWDLATLTTQLAASSHAPSHRTGDVALHTWAVLARIFAVLLVGALGA